MTRAFILLLDSFGVGATPDAHTFGDAGANTLGHIAEAMAGAGMPLDLPNMERLGLGAAARSVSGAWPAGFTMRGGFGAVYGVAGERSSGKDTQSGHWEIAGLPVDFNWGYFSLTTPSFPRELTDALQDVANVSGFLGNCHASGTEIIMRLGDEHCSSGKPIIYTSADSVFQIAAHEEHFGLQRLYSLCESAFELVRPYNIGRVIARPFVGASASYRRTANRHDYAVAPHGETLLDHVNQAGRDVIALGKIGDIFAGKGVTRSLKGTDNMALFDILLSVADEAGDGSLTFVNFVDFDQLFGHRRDVQGYAQALSDFDMRLPEFSARLRPGDLAVITADHGCDPTWPGSDHTREHIPMLFFGPGITGRALAMSPSFSDIGQTLASHLGVRPLAYGNNLL